MDDLARAFVSFFAIIDPIGNVLFFQLFTRGLTAQERFMAASLAVGAAFGMLMLFSLTGTAVLEFMGISLPGFQVAAGLLLVPPAYRLVMEGEPLSAGGPASRRPLDLALVPLATPLMAGPGSLAATISFTDNLGRDTTIVAFSAVLLLSYAGFLTADTLFRLLGEPLLRLLARIVGIVLVAIAVDFILDGIRTYFEL